MVCVVNEKGSILEKSKYSNKTQAAEEFGRSMLSKYPQCRAVCESTAGMWFKTHLAFEKLKIPLVLANPMRLKLSQSGVKTDRIDAAKLAERLRLNAVPQCHVYSPEARHGLDLIRQRVNLVRERTRILNREHTLLDRFDHKPSDSGSSHTAGSRCQQYLDTLKLGPGATAILYQHVRHIRFLNDEIHTLDHLIAGRATCNEDAKIIMSLPGFDAFTALLVAVSIDGIERFSSPKQLVSFMGLCPRVFQSGNTIHHGYMKKESDSILQWAMMQAALTAGIHDNILGACYSKYRKTHPPKVAQSHVANKLAKYIWAMLTKKELYRFYDKSLYDKKLERLPKVDAGKEF